MILTDGLLNTKMGTNKKQIIFLVTASIYLMISCLKLNFNIIEWEYNEIVLLCLSSIIASVIWILFEKIKHK